ncbi:MAG: arginine N-succinyltransferase, partial [Acidimicrobiia bacterium]
TVLSRGRFLFLHLVRSQTPATVAAHMRGRFNDDGAAPFWDCFGAHFSSWADSLEAEAVLAAHPERVDELTDLVLPLTPRDLESLGLVNRASLTAFRMLMDEGLRSNGLYDPVDGGPTVSGELIDTRTSRERIHGRVVAGAGGTLDALVSVPSMARFAVVRTQVTVDPDERVHLSEGAMKSLGVADDALVTVLPLGDT